MVVSSEIVLLALTAVLGGIAGSASLRDSVAQEMGDLGEAIGSLDDSYQFVAPAYQGSACNCPLNGVPTGIQNTGPSTVYNDNPDDNDTQTTASAPPEGVDIDGHIDTFNADNEQGQN